MLAMSGQKVALGWSTLRRLPEVRLLKNDASAYVTVNLVSDFANIVWLQIRFIIIGYNGFLGDFFSCQWPAVGIQIGLLGNAGLNFDST